MKQTDPPPLAVWMLTHWTPGARNEALAGDLLEEFRNGRTAVWYWRQVLAAIAVGCCNEILSRRVLLVFSILWSMFAPAWILLTQLRPHPIIEGAIWRIAWPWSTICYIGLSSLISLTFVWVGMILYLMLQMGITKSVSTRQLGWGILRSVAVFVTVSAILLLLALSRSPSHPLDRRTLTLLGVITDLNPWAILVTRFPFLLALLFGLWGVGSRADRMRGKGIA